jgi:hypothetical protein
MVAKTHKPTLPIYATAWANARSNLYIDRASEHHGRARSSFGSTSTRKREHTNVKPMPMFPVAPPARDDVDQAPVTMQVEGAPGEVELDAVVRAQSSAPQVVRRLTTLEDCLWAAVDALGKLPAEARAVLGADAIIDRAKLLLRGDLEVPEPHEARGVGQTAIGEAHGFATKASDGDSLPAQ